MEGRFNISLVYVGRYFICVSPACSGHSADLWCIWRGRVDGDPSTFLNRWDETWKPGSPRFDPGQQEN